MAAFNVLADVCSLFEPAPEGPGVNEIKIWSLVHGYATLRQHAHLVDPRTGESVEFSAILPDLTPR
jgi:hypothetical protein